MLDGDDAYGILGGSFSTMLCDPGCEEEELYKESLLDEAVDALYEKRSVWMLFVAYYIFFECFQVKRWGLGLG